MAGISNVSISYQPCYLKSCPKFSEIKENPISQVSTMTNGQNEPTIIGVALQKRIQLKKKEQNMNNFQFCVQPDLITFSSPLPMCLEQNMADSLEITPAWKNFRFSNEIVSNSVELQPSNSLASSIIVKLEKASPDTPKERDNINMEAKLTPRDDYHSSDTSESNSELSLLSQFDEENAENQCPDPSDFEDSTRNKILEKNHQESGLTWAKWSEKRSPYKKILDFQIPIVCNKEQRPVQSKKECSEEILIRNVKSTAKLWDTPKEIPGMSLFDDAKMTPKKRKPLCIPPSPEVTPDKGLGFIGQHSQGLGGHYTETFLIKKRKFL